jgi:hypothetical protein
MRRLERRDVDLPGRLIRLRPELSKNKNGRPLPLDGELLEVIQRAFRERRLHCAYVFQKRVGESETVPEKIAKTMTGQDTKVSLTDMISLMRETWLRRQYLIERSQEPSVILMRKTGLTEKFDLGQISDNRWVMQNWWFLSY